MPGGNVPKERWGMYGCLGLIVAALILPGIAIGIAAGWGHYGIAGAGLLACVAIVAFYLSKL